jgi:hypothetical protein
MMDHITHVKNYEAAAQLKENLLNKGVPEDAISIVFNAPSNEAPADISISTLADKNITLAQSPNGTVSAYGAVFTVLATITAGTLLLASGPVAAAIGGAGVATAGVTALLNGIGVPAAEHQKYEMLLHRGEVLVGVPREYAHHVQNLEAA